MIKAQCIFKRRKKGNEMTLIHEGRITNSRERELESQLKASQDEILYLNLERDCLLDWVERINPHLNAESIECSLTCTIEPRYKELKR